MSCIKKNYENRAKQKISEDAAKSKRQCVQYIYASPIRPLALLDVVYATSALSIGSIEANLRKPTSLKNSDIDLIGSTLNDGRKFEKIHFMSAILKRAYYLKTSIHPTSDDQVALGHYIDPLLNSNMIVASVADSQVSWPI